MDIMRKYEESMIEYWNFFGRKPTQSGKSDEI